MGLEILLVEDDASNREIAEVILAREGHQVYVATDGEQAVRRCVEAQEHFDLILMDIQLPVVDGLTVVRVLRHHPATADIPILCMSARASDADKYAGIAAGADGYLRKPYRRSDLLDAIREVMERSQS